MILISYDLLFFLSHDSPQNFYKEANKKFMPTGYSLPHDNPLMKQAKHNTLVVSSVRKTQHFLLFNVHLFVFFFLLEPFPPKYRKKTHLVYKI